MAINNEDLKVTVTIDDEHSAQDILPAVEAAGLLECQSLTTINVILGKLALATDSDQTLAAVRQIPGVASADKALQYGLLDSEDD